MRVNAQETAGLTELSLYSGRPPVFVYTGRIRYLTVSGALVSSGHSPGLINISPADIAEIVSALSHHSIHSCERELHQGFFILPGGIRVGVAGTYSSSGILRDWNSLNFRFAGEYRGCADNLLRIMTDGGSLLICGGVNSGKTTVLRELCRLCGGMHKVSLIDERGEIAAMTNGQPQFDVGLLTGIFSGCTRAQGITAAVRTLAPAMIFTDEIASDDDTAAVIDGAGCGIQFAATVHAMNMAALHTRSVTRSLLDAGVFTHAVFLEGSNSPGSIREIKVLNDVAKA